MPTRQLCVRMSVRATLYAHKGWASGSRKRHTELCNPATMRARPCSHARGVHAPPKHTHTHTHTYTLRRQAGRQAGKHVHTHTHTPAVRPLPKVRGIDSRVEPPHNALALHDLNRRIREPVVLLGAACSAVNLDGGEDRLHQNLNGLSLEYARNRLIPDVLTC